MKPTEEELREIAGWVTDYCNERDWCEVREQCSSLEEAKELFEARENTTTKAPRPCKLKIRGKLWRGEPEKKGSKAKNNDDDKKGKEKGKRGRRKEKGKGEQVQADVQDSGEQGEHNLEMGPGKRKRIESEMDLDTVMEPTK